MPTSTIGSSADHIQAIESLPEATRLWLYARDAELLRRRASDHATGQRGRDAKTSRKAAGVWKYIYEHKSDLDAWLPHLRTDVMHTKMQTDLTCSEVPTKKFIRPILREAIKRGVLKGKTS